MRITGLKAKVVVLSMALSAIGLITGVVGYMTLSSVTEKYHSVASSDLPAVKILGDLRGEFRELRIHVRALGFEGVSQDDANAYLAKALAEIANVKNSFAAYKKIDTSAYKRASFQDLEKAWHEFEVFSGEIVSLTKDYGHNQSQITNLIKEVCPIKAEKFYKALAAETDYNLQLVEESVKLANSTESSGKSLILWLAIGVLIVSPIIAFVFSTKISNSIAYIARQIAKSGHDILTQTESMDSSSTQLSVASAQFTSSLEETVSALEEISSMVQRNSENAKEAAHLSNASKKAAEMGESEIRHLIVSMREISTSSKKIEEIIELIDSIAFQTNLLALNAAVEAARAGEQGRGFAVVAEAVRALAQKSAVAAKDINVLIGESVDLVNKGCKMADRSGEALHQIVTEVSKVSILNADIAAASSEQSTGIHQVSKVMSQFEEATQKNALSAEGITEAVKHLTRLSENSKELNQGLQEIIYGKGVEVLSQAEPKQVTMSAVIPLKPQAQNKGSYEMILPLDEAETQVASTRGTLGEAEGF